MAESLWYYEDAGRPAGPVSEAALAEAIRQGRLARGQRVWTAGQATWVAWESLPSLAALAPPPEVPPPPPPGQFPEARPAAGGLGPDQPGPGWSPPPRATGPVAGGPLRLYPRAPLGARFAAAFVDAVIGGGPVALALGLFAVTSDGDWTGGVPAGLAGVFTVGAALWALYYGFAKDGRPGGQSIGKKLLHLMVVHLPTNRPCTVTQSALRALVQAVLQLVPYVGWLVEPTAVVIASGGRRLGDQAAGTQVILASDYQGSR